MVKGAELVHTTDNLLLIQEMREQSHYHCMRENEQTPSTASDSFATPSSEELLHLFIESTVDFAIIAMTASGTVTVWNAGAERLLGYCGSEIVGATADLIFTPEDRAAGAPRFERETALAHGKAADERWHMHKDGSRFWGSGVLMPLADKKAGFVKIMHDLTERQVTQQRLKESEELFRLLATNIPQLVFRTKPTGERTWGSPQWEIFTGRSVRTSTGLGWLEAVHPDDRDLTVTRWQEAQTKGEYYVEHRIKRIEDGEYRWHQTRAKPIGGGEAAEDWVGTSTDVHEMRKLQETQHVLVAELQHRTRNLLAIVQSIERRTLRTSKTLEEFGAEFEGRLAALGRVQGMLSRTSHALVDLRELVQAELEAHGDGVETRDHVIIQGPPVALPAASAQTLALAIHELATNAVKYGALRYPSGRLSVEWRVEAGSGNERRLVLQWCESGIQLAVGYPERRGYGLELIERALPYQFHAETKLEFAGDGVKCRISAPLPL